MKLVENREPLSGPLAETPVCRRAPGRIRTADPLVRSQFAGSAVGASPRQHAPEASPPGRSDVAFRHESAAFADCDGRIPGPDPEPRRTCLDSAQIWAAHAAVRLARGLRPRDGGR